MPNTKLPILVKCSIGFALVPAIILFALTSCGINDSIRDSSYFINLRKSNVGTQEIWITDVNFGGSHSPCGVLPPKIQKNHVLFETKSLSDVSIKFAFTDPVTDLKSKKEHILEANLSIDTATKEKIRSLPKGKYLLVDLQVNPDNYTLTPVLVFP